MDTTDPDIDTLASVLAALADPIRISIVRMVDEAGELTCAPLAEELSLPQSTLSRHLKMLRDAGLIYSRPDGTSRWVGLCREECELRHPGLLSAILMRG